VSAPLQSLMVDVGTTRMNMIWPMLLAIVLIPPIHAAESQRTPVKAQPVTISQVKSQMVKALAIDTFVTWLKDQPNVAEIDTDPVLLTTAPPQKWIGFTLDGNIRYRFRLMESLEGRVVVVSEEPGRQP
jgi:hypothetical protein